MTRKLTNNEYAQPVVPVDGDGNIINGAVPANTVSTGNVTAIDVTASPHTTPTAGSYVPITLPSGAGTTALQITGTWTGQLEFEGSVDLVNYVSVQASNGSATINAVASAGAMNSIFVLPGAGYRVVRVRASAWTSGTAVITFVASVGTSASIQTGSLPAGTNAIGSIKGTGFNIPVTLTVTNGAYTAADVVGGLITFAGAGSAAGKRSVIHTIVLSGVAALAYELWFFASDITTPALDNAAFTLVAADAAQCKGVIPIATSDYCAAQSAFNVATLRSVGFEFTCVATTLYAYMKAVATTTPGTTTLTLTIKGEFID